MPREDYTFCRRALLDHITILRRKGKKRQIEVTREVLKGIRQQYYRKG